MALIVLLTIALIMVSGVTSAVAGALRVSLLRNNETKALYLAHAGMMDAIVGYLTPTPSPQPQNWFPLGEFTVATNEVFIRRSTGSATYNPQRDVLLTDTSAASMQARTGGRSTIDNWRLRRVSSNLQLTLSALQVRWTGAGGGATHVCINANWNSASCFAVPAGQQASGSLIDIPNRILSNNTAITNNHIRFNTNLAAPNVVVVLTFFLNNIHACASDPAYPSNSPTTADLPVLRQIQLTENCRRTAVYVNGSGAENWGVFTVRSAGVARQPPFDMERGLRAEFRTASGNAGVNPINRIISWAEE